jgi:acyl-CoA reductase-like NAD-dependent aldehyde dehydrogenase
MGDHSHTTHISQRAEDALRTVPLWINGETTQSNPALTFPVYSAKQQRNVCIAQSVDDSKAREACDAAMQAFEGWRKTSIAFRRDILIRAADAFESHRSEVVALQVEETSCEESWAHFNLNYAIINLREIAGSIAFLLGEMPRVESENNVAMVFKEPVGPSLLISP